MNHPLADSSLGFQMVMPFMFWRVVFLGVSFLYLTGFKVAQNTADVIRKNGGGCSWLGLPDSLEDTGVLDLLVPQSSSTKRPFFFFSPHVHDTPSSSAKHIFLHIDFGLV